MEINSRTRGCLDTFLVSSPLIVPLNHVCFISGGGTVVCVSVCVWGALDQEG